MDGTFLAVAGFQDSGFSQETIKMVLGFILNVILLLSAFKLYVNSVPPMNIFCIETRDVQAKGGTSKEQGDRSTTFREVKTIIKARQHRECLQRHPLYNKSSAAKTRGGDYLQAAHGLCSKLELVSRQVRILPLVRPAA